MWYIHTMNQQIPPSYIWFRWYVGAKLHQSLDRLQVVEPNRAVQSRLPHLGGGGLNEGRG